jgi:hypothetical protein
VRGGRAARSSALHRGSLARTGVGRHSEGSSGGDSRHRPDRCGRGSQEHKGPIMALSRRGLLPQRHAETPRYPDFMANEPLPKSLSRLFARLRTEVRRAEASGYDWRSVIDAFRPHTERCWRALPEAERRRFLRHVRPYWDFHRHRMAPKAAEISGSSGGTGNPHPACWRLARSLSAAAGRQLRCPSCASSAPAREACWRRSSRPRRLDANLPGSLRAKLRSAASPVRPCATYIPINHRAITRQSQHDSTFA